MIGQPTLRRFAAAGALAFGLGSAAAAEGPGQRPIPDSWPTLHAPQGFCDAPDALLSDLTALGRVLRRDDDALAVAIFVDCLELDTWRAGRHTAEAIGLVAQTILRESPVTPLESGGDQTPVAMATLAADGGDGAATRGSIDGDGPSPIAVADEDGVRYETEILPPAGALPLRLRMRSQTVGAGFTLERDMVMPFEGEDGVRYMTAAVRAAAIADRIALAPYR